jgi:GLPGLI family protein
MKTITPVLLFIFLLTGSKAYCQSSSVITEGIIEFEKTVNKYAVIEKTIKTYDVNSMWQQAFLDYKSSHPQFLKLNSILTFSKTKTLFAPLSYTGDTNENLWNGKNISDQPNIIYNDLTSKTATTQKKVLEELFLIRDSLRKIKWKITNETREIAGFNCRRANGLMMDSLYLVAFYTNEIPIASGPESFSGLPGMILGLAIPHENVTWFATKVTEKSILDVLPPTKGKSISYQGLKTMLETSFKGYGNRTALLLQALLL